MDIKKYFEDPYAKGPTWIVEGTGGSAMKMLVPDIRQDAYGRIVSFIRVCAPILKAIVTVAIHTGMRKSEIKFLHWNDIDFKKGFICLLRTKNNEKRYIPMNTAVRETLMNVRKHPDSSYVFWGKDGEPFNFRKSFETALRKCGIFGICFHDLRHYICSRPV